MIVAWNPLEIFIPADVFEYPRVFLLATPRRSGFLNIRLPLDVYYPLVMRSPKKLGCAVE